MARAFAGAAGAASVSTKSSRCSASAHLLTRRPERLSGGEKQRVAIGRALLSQPRALLLDEPLAAIDEARRLEILGLIETLRDAFAIPMIFVSHRVDEVARLANEVATIEAGKVVEFLKGAGRGGMNERDKKRRPAGAGRLICRETRSSTSPSVRGRALGADAGLRAHVLGLEQLLFLFACADLSVIETK